jgi:hypothetical protein
MNLSMSSARESIWVWLFWSLGILLALELGACRIAAQVLNKTAGELAGPYLAFAVPWAIFAPLIWWLRKWEERGASPKRLARGWGLGMALFDIAVDVAVFYSGMVLHLMDPTLVVGAFITTVLMSAPTSYFVVYHLVLARISSRVAGNRDTPPPRK